MKTKIVTLLFFIIAISLNAQKKWSLVEAVNYALENNISIKQQQLSNQILEEDILSARGNFYPSLNGSASHNYNFGSYIDNYGDRVSIDSRSNNFSLNTGVLLYNGNRNWIALKQARKTLEAAGFNLQESRNDIMLFVVNSYLQVLFNKENVKISAEQILISESQVEKAKQLVEAGEQPKAIQLEAEATLATNIEQLTVAENNLEISLLNLAQLLQISHKGFDIKDVDINIDAASLIYNDTDKIYNAALNQLPEIKSAELAIENANLAIENAEAGYLPTLSLGGGVGSSYQHRLGEKDVRVIIDPDTNTPVTVSNGFGKQLEDNLGYNVGLSLNIPIFNRFQNKVNVNKAKIRKEQAELQLLDEKINLREAIEKAYADAKAALKQYLAAQKSVEAQKESFNNAQASYNAGVMTSFDFDQVRNRYVNAQSSLVNAKYNFVFRTKLLEYYLGIPIVIE
ncbi:MAG TPA: TolC family protein [Flavobacteriaceae bacterium]|nr:TolC family protein [Flavobacteriaceae bacterium]